MDLGAYWQENKRFVVMVVAGALLFLIGFAIESSIFKDQINAANRAIQLNQNQLRNMEYSKEDLSAVEEQHEALTAAVARLTETASFTPRAEFVPDPQAGSTANHYLRTLSRVRDELLQRANRAGVEIDSSLGMPELSPTAEHEILRYLEALDMVEAIGDLAVRARADRIDRIQVRLDPGHASRQGVGAIERTKVQVVVTGTSLALSRFLTWTQRPPAGGRVLPVGQVEMSPMRGREDLVRLDATFLIARVKPLETPEE